MVKANEKPILSAELGMKRFDFRFMAIGYAVFIVTDYFFDYLLYPYVIYQRGLFWGGIVMTLLSIAFCLASVLLYDLLKKDWLGIEAIKDFKEEIFKKADSKIKVFHKMTAWILRKGYWAEFLFLSIQFDPFITTVYLRNGVRKFNGFKRKEWQIFIISAFVSNAYWTFLSFSGIEIFKKIF